MPSCVHAYTYIMLTWGECGSGLRQRKAASTLHSVASSLVMLICFVPTGSRRIVWGSCVCVRTSCAVKTTSSPALLLAQEHVSTPVSSGSSVWSLGTDSDTHRLCGTSRLQLLLLGELPVVCQGCGGRGEMTIIFIVCLDLVS